MCMADMEGSAFEYTVDAEWVVSREEKWAKDRLWDTRYRYGYGYSNEWECLCSAPFDSIRPDDSLPASIRSKL